MKQMSCGWSGLILALGMAVSAPAAETATFPFVLPWDDASPGVTDVSAWLPKPAGRAGHIRVGDGGQFYAGKERIRFLGVNLSFAAGMPTKEDAPKIAGRLAKFGINVARFHHMDSAKWPDGIRSRDAKTSGELDAEALDRLHYFIAQLKERGIYANLNLVVGRAFNAADGLPAEIETLDSKDRHVVGFFDARQQELQKDYARRLLGARNPYTGMTAAEDPAVAFVEINNENGLVHAWLGHDVDKLPDVFLKDLRRQWNEWLRQRYGTTANLRDAWNAGAQPVGAELLQNGSFTAQMKSWTVERHGGAQANATVVTDVPPKIRATGAKALSIEVVRPGAESWHVQFNQSALPLEGGKAYTLRFWARSDRPRTISASVTQAHEPWSNLGFSASIPLTPEWREFRYVFNAAQSDSQARVTFGTLGGAASRATFAAISLRTGGVGGLAAGESIESGSVPVFERGQFGGRTAAAQRDWMRFLTATEDHYWQSMARFLEHDLKVRAPVTGTIAGCSPLNVQAKLDWVDTHSYWQHPRFPGRPWDPGNWIVENKTMVNERGGNVTGLALRRVLGKPIACTEYNHPAPNTYGSEGFLLLAAYAALQDWDALYVYSYAHSRKDGWNGRKIGSFFDIDQHPTKMATLVGAAALFLRGDVRPAEKLVVANLDAEREVDLLRHARNWDLVQGTHLGIAREAALVHRVALAVEGGKMPRGALRPDEAGAAGNRFESDTRELAWDVATPDRGVVTINTPRSKGVIGYGGGRRFALGEFVIEPAQGLQNGWSTVTLTAMDTAATRWLITATGYAENTGMGWKNAGKSTVGRDWGSAPSRVEGVEARITLPHAATRVEVWSLDERGQRKQKLPLQSTGGKASVTIGPRWETLWYEVVVR
ncbi:MAG: carbohydrate binding domain-containing protein [Verrucomicrobiota bacterium]